MKVFFSYAIYYGLLLLDKLGILGEFGMAIVEIPDSLIRRLHPAVCGWLKDDGYVMLEVIGKPGTYLISFEPANVSKLPVSTMNPFIGSWEEAQRVLKMPQKLAGYEYAKALYGKLSRRSRLPDEMYFAGMIFWWPFDEGEAAVIISLKRIRGGKHPFWTLDYALLPQGNVLVANVVFQLL